MKLFKKITNPEKVKSFISVFVIFFFMNNLIAFGSENKSVFFKCNNIDNEIEEIFFKNSISYNAYDNLENQLKLFFGGYSERSENISYPDLSIMNISNSLREIYKSKLNDMAIIEINYNIYK